jgi:hypothetical protein
MPMWSIFKFIWAAPLTAFGVAPAFLVWLARGHARWCDGALDVHGPIARRVLTLPWLNFSAITIGHIIIARDADCCARAGAHERVHVRQGERWGPLFPLLYCGAGLWQMVLGRTFYWDNPFEVAARRADVPTKATDRT